MGWSWGPIRLPRTWALWAASRPSQLALILLLYFLGIGMTTVGSPFVAGNGTATTLGDVLDWSFVIKTAVGSVALLAVAVTVHYANEYADADTDALADRTPFSGGSGALVETGIPPAMLRTATGVSCVVAVALTLGGFVTGHLSALAVGLLTVILAAGVAYSLPPIALIRRGAGEPVNMLLGGLLLPLYGASVMAIPRAAAALAVVPFTLVVGCNLLAVHWPDRRADAAVGKTTLVVRWSPQRIRRVYTLLAVSAAMVTATLWWRGILPSAVALAHLAPSPFLVWGWATITKRRSPLPAVAAMVVLAVVSTVTWWWVGLV